MWRRYLVNAGQARTVNLLTFNVIYAACVVRRRPVVARWHFNLMVADCVRMCLCQLICWTSAELNVHIVCLNVKIYTHFASINKF